MKKICTWLLVAAFCLGTISLSGCGGPKKLDGPKPKTPDEGK